jgi:hypothetical protein
VVCGNAARVCESAARINVAAGDRQPIDVAAHSGTQRYPISIGESRCANTEPGGKRQRQQEGNYALAASWQGGHWSWTKHEGTLIFLLSHRYFGEFRFRIWNSFVRGTKQPIYSSTISSPPNQRTSK